jgi:hypothetical protein
MEKEFREGFAWGLLVAVLLAVLGFRFGKSRARQRDGSGLVSVPGGKAKTPIPGDAPVAPSLSADPTAV